MWRRFPRGSSVAAMTEQEQVPRSRDARLAEVDRIVRAAGEGAPHGALRATLDQLRHRLGRAHTACDQVEDRVWAEYVARLDRGLDELAIEVDRAASDADAATDVTLFVHATRLEIDGWMLRLDHARDGRDGSTAARDLAARASRDLEDYQRGVAGRADVERTMDGIREAAG
jgi:hypothetical protein